MEPDEEQDSWVARTESELFEEMQQEGVVPGQDVQDDLDDEGEEGEEEFDEDFADDEFADDDFVDGEFNMQARPEGFGDAAFSASELDGWDFDESSITELQDDEESEKLTESQVEALFDGDDDYLDRRAPKTFKQQMLDKERAARPDWMKPPPGRR